MQYTQNFIKNIIFSMFYLFLNMKFDNYDSY